MAQLSREHDWLQNGKKAIFRKYLTPFANKENIHALEVGAFEGRSTLFFCGNFLQGTGSFITVIDSWKGNMVYGTENEHIVSLNGVYTRFKENVVLLPVDTIRGDSWRELPKFPEEYYDFMYIDGSHLAIDVLEDAVLAFRTLKPGGLMFFDDYLWQVPFPEWQRPTAGIDAFLKVFEREIEMHQIERIESRDEFMVVIQKRSAPRSSSIVL